MGVWDLFLPPSSLSSVVRQERDLQPLPGGPALLWGCVVGVLVGRVVWSWVQRAGGKWQGNQGQRPGSSLGEASSPRRQGSGGHFTGLGC